jgi:hypothetical protein
MAPPDASCGYWIWTASKRSPKKCTHRPWRPRKRCPSQDNAIGNAEPPFKSDKLSRRPNQIADPWMSLTMGSESDPITTRQNDGLIKKLTEKTNASQTREDRDS